MKEVRGLILAAGRGSRMGSLTTNTPKCLTKLHGRELIRYQIDAMRAAGIKEIAVVTGFHGEQLEEFGDFRIHNPDWASTNMVASLRLARHWLLSGACIVSYSDIFFEWHAVQDLLRADGDLAIAYDPNWLDHWSKRFDDPLSDAETFRIDTTGRLLEIGGRAQAVSDIEGQYMGLLRFNPSGWKEIENLLNQMDSEQCRTIQMTAVIQLAISNSRIKIHGVRYHGVWGEIDSEQDLAIYENADLSSGMLRPS